MSVTGGAALLTLSYPAWAVKNLARSAISLSGARSVAYQDHVNAQKPFQLASMLLKVSQHDVGLSRTAYLQRHLPRTRVLLCWFFEQ